MLADICVLAVVVFFVYSGYKAGLMKSLIKVLSYIVSIVISFFLYPVVSEGLMKTALYEKLTEVILKNVGSNGVSGTIENNAFGMLEKYINDGVSAATANISTALATLIINIIAFVIILILSKIIIRVVGNLFGIFTKLPIIKQFNRLGGGILGGLIGILVLYIVCAVMFLFAPVKPESRISKEMENSVFAAEIYENNLILNLIRKGQ